jgi:hypothetical protein
MKILNVKITDLLSNKKTSLEVEVEDYIFQHLDLLETIAHEDVETVNITYPDGTDMGNYYNLIYDSCVALLIDVVKKAMNLKGEETLLFDDFIDDPIGIKLGYVEHVDDLIRQVR